MPESDDFALLIRRVRAGDPLAAQELFSNYEPAIRREARLRLGPSVRPVYDSTDISQSVFGSFLLRIIAGEYELETPRHLMRLLLAIARNKVRERIRNRREASLGTFEAEAEDPTHGILTRDFVVEFRRRLSADELALWERRRQDLSWQAISTELGTPEPSLRKRYSRAIRRVASELGLEDAR
jgi:DNA-directed RNA polymerase specialized sigma24 family protein